MKAQDIVNALSANVPLYTTGFSNTVSIDSVTVVGTTATVTTATVHGLQNGYNTTLLGIEAPVQIDAASFTRVGTFATFETLQDHDFTLSQRDKSSGGKTLTLSGAVEVEFNGTFDIVSVINRRKLQISVADSGSTTISGSPLVDNANGNLFNGLVTVSNITTTTFEYTLLQSYPIDPVVTNASLQNNLRILSVLDIEQYLRDVYTKQAVDDDQLVVQLGDVVQSKKRDEETDASSSTVGEYSYTPVLIQPFAVYIVQNVTDDLTGSKARDRVESEFIPAIFKSVFRRDFNTQFTYSQYRTTFTGHGVFAFDDQLGKNKALYVHEVSFEQLAQLCSSDMVGPDDNVAMRDVGYTVTTDLGAGELTAGVDLDEEPIQ